MGNGYLKVLGRNIPKPKGGKVSVSKLGKKACGKTDSQNLYNDLLMIQSFNRLPTK